MTVSIYWYFLSQRSGRGQRPSCGFSL